MLLFFVQQYFEILNGGVVHTFTFAPMVALINFVVI